MSSSITKSFKERNPFQKRKAEATRIRAKYPDRIPVICEVASKSDIGTLDKEKFLVPGELTVGQFIYVIRKKIELGPEKALFLFINGTLPPTSATILDVWNQYKEPCGFLMTKVSGENTFGSL